MDLGVNLHERGRGRRKREERQEGKEVRLDVNTNNMKGGEGGGRKK